MSSFLALLNRLRQCNYPPVAPRAEEGQVIRFGILGTASIASPALISASKVQPETLVYAVAGRSPPKVEAFAEKHGIRMVYSGPDCYQALIHDPDVDAVYIPWLSDLTPFKKLPNHLHYEWTMKALNAGKHVLVEKPIANTADEARKMHELAEEKGLTLMEGMHLRFHPAVQRTKQIVESGELGAVKHVESNITFPAGLNASYTSESFDQGKGYALDMVRNMSSSNPTSVSSASYKASPTSPKADDRSEAHFVLPNDVTATIRQDMFLPFALGFIPPIPDFDFSVQCEGGTVTMRYFMISHIFHTITVEKRGGETRVEKAYQFTEGRAQGEVWWTSFMHQLGAFVDVVHKREPRAWYSKEESIANMEAIEMVYGKVSGRIPRTI
ncbi:NAD(P)-binding protein [Crassisporium funariophilum]|nr:NAD(P)-binding protein [Crassisporium funariophilum]